MKLYEIPRGSVITGVECKNDKGELLGDSVTFLSPDGQYSYCRVTGTKHVVHLHVLTELEQNEDGTYSLAKTS